MNRFEAYIHKTLKGTFLSRREKATLQEEMECHLEESYLAHLEAGQPEDEAIDRAICDFGSVKVVNRQIIRNTYLISPKWFLTASCLCFLALGLSAYVIMRYNDLDIHTWKFLPTPAFVAFLHRFFPTPNQWAVVGTLCFMFIFARKNADRLWILLSCIPLAWPSLLLRLYPRLLNHYYAYWTFHDVTISSWPITSPIGPASMVGYFIIFTFGVVIYIRTRNFAVSLTPLLMTIPLTSWPFLRDWIQSTLYNHTHSPVFWGHYSPFDNTHFLSGLIVSVIARFIVFIALLGICKWLAFNTWRKGPAASNG